MGSQSEKTRQLQKIHFQQLIAKRQDLLRSKGVDEEHLKKDAIIKHLQAGFERTARAIASITARERIISNVKTQKANAVKTSEGKEKIRAKSESEEPPKKKKVKSARKAPTAE